jgi:hypothetical protein
VQRSNLPDENVPLFRPAGKMGVRTIFYDMLWFGLVGGREKK